MPLPSDETIVATSENLVKTLRGVFGTPESHRPAHANGRLLRGTFTPSPLASTLSCAPHFTSPSTPILARFSSSTGLPQIPDTNPNANPRGFAVRFLLPSSSSSSSSRDAGHPHQHERPTKADQYQQQQHQTHSPHTDIIAHSTPYFPTRTGEGFLAMLRSIGDGSIGDFLQANPSAKTFVEAPKPSPVSFATQTFWGVNAFVLVGGQGEGGKRTVVRYRVVPVGGEGGVRTLSEEELKAKTPTYLFDELVERFSSSSPSPSPSPSPSSSSSFSFNNDKAKISFHLLAQIAESGDPTDDATEIWPEEGRRVVELGRLDLCSLLGEEESAEAQKRVIFDPIPRVEGVEASDDPLLEVRAGVYLISGRGRRGA